MYVPGPRSAERARPTGLELQVLCGVEVMRETEKLKRGVKARVRVSGATGLPEGPKTLGTRESPRGFRAKE